MNKYFYESVSTIRFLEDVSMDEVQPTLASVINNSMLFNEPLKELHHQNCFKMYVFVHHIHLNRIEFTEKVECIALTCVH